MTSHEDAAHLLRRVGFGGTSTEIEALVPLSWEAAVDRVLDTSKAPAAGAGPSLPAPGTALVGDQWWNAYVAMTGWWLDRMATAPRRAAPGEAHALLARPLRHRQEKVNNAR